MKGFDSQEEFFRMVAGVDLSTIALRAEFEVWQIKDGTKEGLQKLKKSI